MNSVLQKSFWSGKKVLVTGHTGFKGAWLMCLLKELGAIPLGYSLPPPSQPSMYELLNIRKDLIECIDDIRNEKVFSQFAQTHSPDIVVHMAAQPLVRLSYIEPVDTISTNVVGTAHVLNALRKVRSVKAIVVVTTDKCYENNEWFWAYRENDRLGGKDPYSASKAATEIIAQSFFQSFFKDLNCGVATARAGNVIGGGDFAADRIIPDIVRALKSDNTLKLRNPKSVRPWQHVIEPIVGYLMLAQKLYEKPQEYSEAFNFGPDLESCVSVAGIIELMNLQLKQDIPIENGVEGAMKESKLLTLDNSKARDVLNWKPKWKIAQTIQKTCAWYSLYLEGKDLRQITQMQITEYTGLS